MPGVAVLPLGTGNDLSRTLGWGSAYYGKPIHAIMHKLSCANSVNMDRWKVTFSPFEDQYCQVNGNETGRDTSEDDSTDQEKGKQRIDSDFSTSLKPELFSSEEEEEEEKEIKIGIGKEVIMNNYLSVGFDAEMVLGFHEMRLRNAELFNHVLVNKAWYATFAARNLIHHTRPIKEVCSVRVDDVYDLKIPSKVKSMTIMNLPTYGGSDVWGISNSILSEQWHSRYGKIYEDVRPSISDGKLEIVGMANVAHLGAIRTHICPGFRLAQAHKIDIRLLEQLPLHIDGEPVLLPPCKITIRFYDQVKLLFNPEKVGSTL